MSLSESPSGVASLSRPSGLKRLFDLALAVTTLPITVPMMLAIGVAIKLGSCGPP